MPAWAESLQHIGALATSRQATGRRIVVAVAVPTRCHAAILVALGAVLSRCRIPVKPDDPNKHFTRLCALPPGTKILVTNGKKRHNGLVMGIDHIHGQPLLKLKLATEDKSVTYIAEQHADTVQIEEWDGTLPLKISNTQDKRIVRRADFLEAAFAGHGPRDFALWSRIDAVIVGSAARLRAEIVNTRIGTRLPDGPFVFGALQDLLRPSCMAPKRAYRSHIISDTAPDLSILPKSGAWTTIFDGARPFIRYRDALPSACHIVVLDRTAHNFGDAAEIVNQQYFRRSDDLPDFQRIPGIPWGMEVMAYEEAGP